MPKEINGYRIVEKAQGGMAVVYIVQVFVVLLK